jgi:diguanylate cyclase (GGDEF)-like protein
MLPPSSYSFSKRNERYLYDEIRYQRQRLALKVFLFLGVLILFPSATVDYWMFSHKSLAFVELIFGVLSLSVLVLILLGFSLSPFASYVFVTMTGMIIWVITMMMETDISTLLWVGIFPFIAFYLLGIRHGLFAHILFTTIILSTLLLWPHQLVYNVNTQIIVNLTGILVAFGVFAYLYEYTSDLANRKWIRHSYTDALTGIGNRKLFSLLLDKYLASTARHDRPVTLVLIDLDHFKRVNDNYGHIIGDAVLVEVAILIRSSIRKEDTLTRWGGEEFMIILPDTNLDDAKALAEKLRSLIQHHPFKSIQQITASFGVAQVQQNLDIDANTQLVDAALYRAKENGRNRVEGS